MTIATFNKKTFEKEIGKLDEKMQERIALFGTPIEGITENELQIEVFPNRPDLIPYQNFKRSFLAFLDKKPGLKVYKTNKPEKNYQVKIDSSLKNIWPYTACVIVKDLKLDNEKIKELIDIQEKLHFTLGRKRKKLAIGIYPLDKITLPITFKALEPDQIKFIPLESEKEMSGLQILQRHPTGKEYAHILAGKIKFPIFVDAENKILSMPPIINSQETGRVTEKTKDVFVECSGIDFEVLNKCLNILTTTLSEMGGKIYQMELDYGSEKYLTPNLEPKKMKLNPENVKKILGIDLNEKEIKKLLERMEYNYNKNEVEIPSWRTDILHEVDLIEDIAIAYGYENFIPEIPEISTIGREDEKEKFKRKISEILSGLEMLELSNYHLTTNKDQFQKMGIQEKQEKGFIELENSKTDYTILRKDLTHYLLKIISENVDTEYPQRIFETGRIFEIINDKIVEKENLAIAITPGNFTEIKQILDYLSKMIKKEIKIFETSDIPNWFIEGRTGEIKLDNKKIGYIGEIHPRILRNWKIKMPVSILEISLGELI